jgi:hypothetical protein
MRSACVGAGNRRRSEADEPIMPLCPYASSDDSVPFGPAWPSTAVTVPPIITGKVDGFVDDLINDFLDTVDNCHRQPHVVPLAMFVTSCPHTEEDKDTFLGVQVGPYWRPHSRYVLEKGMARASSVLYVVLLSTDFCSRWLEFKRGEF